MGAIGPYLIILQQSRAPQRNHLLTVSTFERGRPKYDVKVLLFVWFADGLDGAAEVFANWLTKRSLDASHAISVAVAKERAVAASAQSVTIAHFCLRCVVPRIVV